ncbi:unnamed protein product [Bemisia tabaci]|uniref:Uncharacterized protein n=1 Tax=Bemisia tabaci TaxID=7038 RepID=A0A9P0A7B0_BEMTA|nr:unnamed protein product [Bemisia tabaci]
MRKCSDRISPSVAKLQVDTSVPLVPRSPPPPGPVYIKREPSEHKALLHGILSQHHVALLTYNASNTGSDTLPVPFAGASGFQKRSRARRLRPNGRGSGWRRHKAHKTGINKASATMDHGGSPGASLPFHGEEPATGPPIRGIETGLSALSRPLANLLSSPALGRIPHLAASSSSSIV